tara:strand:- start:561 stop:737 length:177 start_codon:yes stop_codon:yes gene_type:complete
MKTYIVDVHEVWIASMQIEAESEEEALTLASAREGQQVQFEYDRLLHGHETITYSEDK